MSGIAALLLPTPQETALLRLCLCCLDRAAGNGDGERPAGFRSWLDANAARYPLLLPMFGAGSGTSLPVSNEIRTLGRAAYVREELRRGTVRAICNKAFRSLNDRGIPFVVLGGIALAEEAYPDPALRHCHDCRLRVAPEDRDRARRVLSECGFAASSPTGEGAATAVLIHASGFPLALHGRLLGDLPLGDPFPVDAEPTRSRTLCGVAVRVSAPEAALVRALCRGLLGRGRGSLLWATDSWTLATRGGLDWGAFVEGVRRTGAVAGIAALTAYLADELEARIPAGVTETLEDAGRRAGIRERMFLVRAARGAPMGSVSRLVRRARGWREYAAIAAWIGGRPWRQAERRGTGPERRGVAG